MEGLVTLEAAEGVAVLTLDRPAKHNAITNAMAGQLAAHARAINEDDSVRAVLLRGRYLARQELDALLEAAAADARRR